MPDYFYFDQTNQKYGPIDEQQLRELAVAGIIKPNTPMETVEGHKGIAKQIPGLLFTKSATSDSAVLQWYARVAIMCGIALILCVLFLSHLRISETFERNAENTVNPKAEYLRISETFERNAGNTVNPKAEHMGHEPINLFDRRK